MISIINRTVLLDNIRIYSAPDMINVVHIFNDKIILLYDSHGLIPPGPEMRDKKKVTSDQSLEEVNRNVLMIDLKGNILWRIKSSASHYNPWTVVAQDIEPSPNWFASNQDGYEYDIDIKTGIVSNKIFMR